MATKIDTRSARGRLQARDNVYWASPVRPGLTIGYRRPSQGVGAFYAREYRGTRYHVRRLGLADDVAPADGEGVLDYGQAVNIALGQAAETKRQQDALVGFAIEAPIYFVSDAAADYLAHLARERRSADAIQDATWTIKAHILPPLGQQVVSTLSAPLLKQWRDALLEDRTKATVNRIWNTLRAILAFAFESERCPTDEAWRRIKPLKGATVARQRFLTIEEIQALLAVCDGIFGDLVRAGLYSGARYSELARLKVGDFSHNRGLLHIARSKSGHSRDIVLSEVAIAFFAALTAARDSRELIFPGFNKSAQARPMKRAISAAGIKGDVSFHTLRHTYASHLVMNGTPLIAVARNLGHRSTAMVEKTYGHLSDDFLTKTLRKGVADFQF